MQQRESDFDLCILSAKHGVLDPDDLISPYDQRMDIQRARELAPQVQSELKKRICHGDYEKVAL